MKKFLLTGIATLLPLAITTFFIIFTIDLITTPFVGIVENFIVKHGAKEMLERHSFLLLLASRIIVLLLLFCTILILSIFGRRIFFSWFIHSVQYIFCRIPIIKTIYKIIKEIGVGFLKKEHKKLFQGAVLISFPHKKVSAFALLSGLPPVSMDDQGRKFRSVFVPTSPHPISGFLLMCEERELKHTDIETEELVKFLLSGGAYIPEEGASHHGL